MASSARRIRARRRKGAGLVSSAGIMRYFEIEKAKFTLHPRTVLIATILLAILMVGLNLIS